MRYHPKVIKLTLEELGLLSQEAKKTLEECEGDTLVWNDTPQGYDFWCRLLEEAELEVDELTTEYYVDALRAYCHKSSSCCIHECPENHELCKDSLGLDTSIAWEAAAILAEGNVAGLTDFYYAVKRHANKYPKLTALLWLAMKKGEYI